MSCLTQLSRTRDLLQIVLHNALDGSSGMLPNESIKRMLSLQKYPYRDCSKPSIIHPYTDLPHVCNLTSQKSDR